MNAVIVSASKETNGQNTRYAKASARHGEDAGVVRAFAIGKSDPAGVVARFQAAAEKGDALRIRSASNPDGSYLAFPHDLVWGEDDDEIARLIEEADVVHLNNSDRAVKRFHIHKPILIHHHGTLFRNNATHFRQVANLKRMISAVSTVDLLRFGPDWLHWLPTAYDVRSLQAFGKAHRRPTDDRILVVHAPTNREFKGTDVFLAAIEKLRAEGLPIDLDLIEGVSNAECMERKARADILFDQLTWGYGCNAVEAWAMGIPVVAGSDEWTDQKMREMWGDVPYAVASATSLADVLRQMVTSTGMRRTYAMKGLAHVKRYHDEQPALATLAQLYAKAIRHFVGNVPDLDHPVRFEGPAGLRLVMPWGRAVTFEDGRYETTHPDEAQRLRYFVTKRPSFGVTEVA